MKGVQAIVLAVGATYGLANSLQESSAAGPFLDSRNIRNGISMLTTGYTDQPYCAINPNSKIAGGEAWTCVITASKGSEGSAGEQVYSVVSDDQGVTWSDPVAVELGTSHPGGLPNAYANIVYSEELNRM